MEEMKEKAPEQAAEEELIAAEGEESCEAPDTQRAEEALEQERERLRSMLTEYEHRLAELAAAEELSRRGLSPAFAPYLAAGEGETLEEKVDAFEELLREAVRQEMLSRLRRDSAPKAPAAAKSYSREELRGMSAKEINAHWEEIARALRN